MAHKCEFCDLKIGEEKTINENDGLLLCIANIKNKIYLIASDGGVYTEKQINYCPMCGRKLSK